MPGSKDESEMLRKILTAITIVEALSPERLIDTAEQIALDNPTDCELRSWVVPGARLEGLLILALIWRSDASYSAFKKFLGVIGLLAMLYPRSYIEFGSELAYVDSKKCNWKPWVYLGTRVVGFVYVTIALSELRQE